MEHYVKIYDWMLELGLNGRELNALAVITSFGQDGGWFQGSASYLGRWMGVKKKETVRIALKSLVDKHLVEKRDRWEKGEKFCDYKPVRKTAQVGREPAQSGPKNGQGGGPKNGHHYNRPDTNSDSYIEKKEIYKETFCHLSVEDFKKGHRR